jgi:MFS family permease
MAACTFAQFVFGVLAPYIIDEFGISRSELGFLTTSSFLVGGIASPFAGRLVDMMGGRRVFVASLLLTLGATALMAGAGAYGLMLAGAGLTGISLATCNPTTNKLIAEQVAPGERGVVMGVKQAGVQVGAFLIGILIPAAATAFGWRGALASTAVMPAAGVVGALGLVPRDPAYRPRAEVRTRPSTGAMATVKWLAVYAFLMGAGVAIIGIYLPLYAQEAVGFSIGAAGTLAGVIGLVGIMSRVGWGWGADRTGEFRRPLAIMALGSAAAALLALVSAHSEAWVLWLAAIAFGTTAVTWNVVGMLAVVAEVDSTEAGRASGYVQSGFYGGFVASPYAFGYSVDTTGTYDWGWAAVAVVFAAAALLAGVWQQRS